ncbi:MAG: TRAP transporter small permease [Proteobacteria bacterium]|nr:TRAP transporter small permease [Pseudomonadota bacterium]
MDRVHAIAERIANFGAYGGCMLLFVAAVVVSVEVVIRKLFGLSLGGADELGGYALGISMAWGYSFALFKKTHIRVDAIYLRFPLAVRSVLDVVSLASFTAMVAMLCYRAAFVISETIRLEARSSTPLATPLIVPQGLWMAGLVFFLFCLALFTVRTAQALWRRDLAAVQRLAAPLSVTEEVAEEVASAATRLRAGAD